MKTDWFAYELRVRYPETDQMGIVYHANYLHWLELGRVELLRELGMPYKELEARGIFVPVLDLSIHYHISAAYDDRIVVLTRVQEYNTLKISFEYQINRPGEGERSELLATALTRHVWTNRKRRPARMDREAPEVFQLLRDQFPERFKGKIC